MLFHSVEERFALISLSHALLYTPTREHFGIVPCEAMALGTPVIACNSGGPLETVVNGRTGFLCEGDPVEFANNMMRFVIDSQLSSRMAEPCRKHVEDNFTEKKLKSRLERIFSKVVSEKGNPRANYFLKKCYFALIR